MRAIENQKTNKKMVLIPQLTVSEQGIPMASSLDVANVFGKEHYNVLRDIENLLKDIPEDWQQLNFEFMSYDVKIGNGATRKDPMYLLTRDAFTLLAMGFTGKKAMQFKIAYIEAFNAMEKALLKSDNSNKKIPEKEQPKIATIFDEITNPNERTLLAMKGIIQFTAFLNNTTYEAMEKFYLDFFGISSLNECTAITAYELIKLTKIKRYKLANNFPLSMQPKLEVLKNTFYGLIDFWKLIIPDLTDKNAENYCCNMCGIKSLQEIQTEEQYLKVIFIIFRAFFVADIYDEKNQTF